MDHIKIALFILCSFFGIEDGIIAADKTTVTVHPDTQEIVIIQENLFTIIQSEKDNTIALEQWENIVNAKKDNTSWAKDLDSFYNKTFTLKSKEKAIQPYFKFNYSTKEDLRAIGIWYNEDNNQFSFNHIPQQNLKTTDGKLVENYWFFDADKTFSFTIEPFLQMPERYQKFKTPLSEIINN